MEQKSFADIFEDVTKQAVKIQKKDYLPMGRYPIIDQGQEWCAGYTDREDGLFQDVPAYIFGDHTRIIKYTDEPFYLGADGVKLLKLREGIQANPRFFYYALKSQRIPDTGYNRHFKWLKESLYPVPTLNEQTHIADTLDTLSTLITLCKMKIFLFDELVKSRFIELFGDPVTNPMGWEINSLDKHLEVVGGYAFKSSKFTQDGIPILRIGNINSGSFQETNMVYWSKDDNLARYEILPGDLVISLTGTVGKNDYGNVCIMGNHYPLYYLNQRNAKLSLFPTLSPQYIASVMRDEAIKNILTGISRGIRQANISNKDILALKIPIPPLALQNEFAAFVEQVDKSKGVLRQLLEKQQTLKAALMQEYFAVH